jgi:hypothetical protein
MEHFTSISNSVTEQKVAQAKEILDQMDEETIILAINHLYKMIIKTMVLISLNPDNKESILTNFIDTFITSKPTDSQVVTTEDEMLSTYATPVASIYANFIRDQPTIVTYADYISAQTNVKLFIRQIITGMGVVH